MEGLKSWDSTPRFWFLFTPREQKTLRLFWVVFSCCWLWIVRRVLLSDLGKCHDSKLESKLTKCNSAAMNGTVSPSPAPQILCWIFSRIHCNYIAFSVGRFPPSQQQLHYQGSKSHFLSGIFINLYFPQLLGVGASQKYHLGALDLGDVILEAIMFRFHVKLWELMSLLVAVDCTSSNYSGFCCANVAYCHCPS